MDSSVNHSSSDEKEDDGDGITPTGVTQEQLQTLQSLIPNSSKTDKRSILEGVFDYLRRIHEETDQIERELSQRSDNINTSGSQSSGPSQGPQILKVEIEKLMEDIFVVKVSWRRGPGVAGNVQRVVECLDVKMTSIAVVEKNPDEMLMTASVEGTI